MGDLKFSEANCSIQTDLCKRGMGDLKFSEANCSIQTDLCKRGSGEWET